MKTSSAPTALRNTAPNLMMTFQNHKDQELFDKHILAACQATQAAIDMLSELPSIDHEGQVDEEDLGAFVRLGRLEAAKAILMIEHPDVVKEVEKLG
jgi:hypothetical protein